MESISTLMHQPSIFNDEKGAEQPKLNRLLSESLLNCDPVEENALFNHKNSFRTVDEVPHNPLALERLDSTDFKK